MAHWSSSTARPQYGDAAYPSQPYGYAAAQVNPQSHQQYQPTPPQIRNPFGAPTVQNNYAGHNAGYDPEYEVQLAQWQANYAPPVEQDTRTKSDNANFAPLGVRGEKAGPATTAAANTDSGSGAAKPADHANKTVIRKGGGQTWEDASLLEWDPTQFRIMVGNLAGEVTDDSLAKAFAAYGVSKARVIRDKRTTKSKGYGFVAFFDGEKGFKAAREMVGKYIGSHPVTIKRSHTSVAPVEQKHNKHNKRNKGRKDRAPDPLRANTGAHIEKKPVKNTTGLKLLG